MSAFIESQKAARLRRRARLPHPRGLPRRRTMSARAAGARRGGARDEQLLADDPRAARGQLRGLRVPQDASGARARRRLGRRARPRQAADARARHPRRQAPRQALAHHRARPATPRGGLTASSATSPPAARIGSTSPISPTCAAGKALLFFAFVIDVYSRRIVGWQLTAHMRASLVCDALRMAVCTRPRHGADVKLVHHSDRGSQGGFNWSSQHLDLGGVHGQASGLDAGIDGSVANEVAGSAVVTARDPARVLA